ncbi:G patch domain-containing protein 3-like [Amphiura filiformis]|uniref:G patch domain-containing protein 3-like n=1 Tax=Amphiura filiformis TaxID=82378 RepID=UPI003B21F428
MAAPMEQKKLVYAAVTNIPSEFHSSDLRNYFSQFIEGKGFVCFHFRHRPEFRRNGDTSIEAKNTDKLKLTTGTGTASHIASTTSDLGTRRVHSKKNEADQTHQTSKGQTTCCVVRLTNHNFIKFMKMYHKKLWIDKTGEIMSARCMIVKIRVRSDNEVNPPVQYQTRAEQRTIPSDRQVFTQTDLLQLAELHPPDIMPNGNVGTPTSVFLQFIRECRLPPKMIQKLGLSFPKNRSNKRYGNVPFDYGGDVAEGRDDSEFVATGAGHDISNADDETKEEEEEEESGDDQNRVTGLGKDSERKGKVKPNHGNQKEPREHSEEDEDKSESGEDDDDDTCEEWERHESLHNDVTRQERNDERLFESEMEVTWDKGSSGLVFYTDAAYWRELEGDFDEQTSDNFNVDMSVYYDPDGGDKDARDMVQMRYDQRRRQGLEMDSVFTGGLGNFEKHTKGVGRKVMEKQGWKEGQGIGKNASGMADALDNEGQTSRDKRGLGYYGEKLSHNPSTSSRKRRGDREVIISSVYDDPEHTDPAEPLLRSRGPYHLKYRDEVKFKKGENSDDL